VTERRKSAVWGYPDIRARLRCFRSLLLLISPYLYLAKALVPDLEPTRIGYARFGGNILQSINFT